MIVYQVVLKYWRSYRIDCVDCEVECIKRKERHPFSVCFGKSDSKMRTQLFLRQMKVMAVNPKYRHFLPYIYKAANS